MGTISRGTVRKYKLKYLQDNWTKYIYHEHWTLSWHKLNFWFKRLETNLAFPQSMKKFLYFIDYFHYLYLSRRNSRHKVIINQQLKVTKEGGGGEGEKSNIFLNLQTPYVYMIYYSIWQGRGRLRGSFIFYEPKGSKWVFATKSNFLIQSPRFKSFCSGRNFLNPA